MREGTRVALGLSAMSKLLLHVIDGATTITLEFSSFPVRIGRDGSAHAQLAYSFVSRQHARIDLLDGRLVLRDAGSSHGTYVRGGDERVGPHGISLEAVRGIFHIGTLRLRAELVADAPPPADAETVLERRNETRCYDSVVPETIDSRAALVQARAPLEALRRAREAVRHALVGMTDTLEPSRCTAMLRDLVAEFPGAARRPSRALARNETRRGPARRQHRRAASTPRAGGVVRAV